MTVPTVSWDETSPVGSQAIKLGDNRIRELKTQIREIVAVDHDMESSGQDTDWGQHKQVTLQEAADIGTGAEGVPILGAQTADDKAELTFTDEDDNDIQLTSGGKLGSASTNLTINDGDVAGDATISGTVAIGTALEMGGISIDEILDEDDMASNSATGVPTQQSVKAYIDAQTFVSGVYDSGWFAVSQGDSYAKTHGLGTTKLAIFRYFASSIDGKIGSEGCTMTDLVDTGIGGSGSSAAAGIGISNITTTTFNVRTAAHVAFFLNSNGTKNGGDQDVTTYTNGYCRIIAIAIA